MNFAFNRFKEPSTWASLAVLASIIKPDLGPKLDAMAPALAILAAAAGALLPERKAAP